MLRRELVVASTLTDRPVSPNNYAVQRTNVVMETVKAATLATARKLEMLAAEQRKKGKRERERVGKEKCGKKEKDRRGRERERERVNFM